MRYTLGDGIVVGSLAAVVKPNWGRDEFRGVLGVFPHSPTCLP
jgi:hypothetical protein